MLRLHVHALPPPGAPLRIDGPELRHLRSLRLAPGDHFVVFDGQGDEHEAELTALTPRGAEAKVLAARAVARESPLELVLCPALLKGSKMDLVIEKATELGVQRIAPVVTQYAIGQRADVPRWQRIAVAAAKQSGRTRVPRVDPPVALADRITEPWRGLALLCWEEEAAAARFGDLPAAADAVVLIVGPEGGFSAAEVARARERGFATVGLGRRVLRAETAAIVAVTLAQHRWGDG